MNTKLASLLGFAVLLCASIIPDAHAMRWYSPSTGRWLSRDPIGELGAQCEYLFVGNEPISGTDFLGMIIVGKCLDNWLNAHGQKYTRSTRTVAGLCEYSHSPGGSESTETEFILDRMLRSTTKFKIKQESPGEESNLQNHVDKRIAVRDAAKAITVAGPDATTCWHAARAVFTSVGADRSLRDIADRVWITGDWGRIANRDALRHVSEWDPFKYGENIIFLGKEESLKFWGWYGPNKPTKMQTYGDWVTQIRNWANLRGEVKGDPQLGSPFPADMLDASATPKAFFPSEGLQ